MTVKPWKPGTWLAGDGRPRVLVEEPDRAVQWAVERGLRAHGLDVACCCGPEGMGRQRCALLVTGGCVLAEGADLIYTSLHWADRESRDVLTALTDTYPTVPIVVEATQPQLAQCPELSEHATVVAVPVTMSSMLRAIDGALP